MLLLVFGGVFPSGTLTVRVLPGYPIVLDAGSRLELLFVRLMRPMNSLSSNPQLFCNHLQPREIFRLLSSNVQECDSLHITVHIYLFLEVKNPKIY